MRREKNVFILSNRFRFNFTLNSALAFGDANKFTMHNNLLVCVSMYDYDQRTLLAHRISLNFGGYVCDEKCCISIMVVRKNEIDTQIEPNNEISQPLYVLRNANAKQRTNRLLTKFHNIKEVKDGNNFHKICKIFVASGLYHVLHII